MDIKEQFVVGGCLPQKKDKRDWKIDKLLPLGAVQLPQEFLPTYENDFTYNQGRSSECCACAYTYLRHLQEMDREEQSGFVEPFSPSFTYANRDSNENFEGMYMRNCLKRSKLGTLPWKYFPNFYSLNKCQDIFNKNKIRFYTLAYPFRTSSFYTVNTEEEFKTAIYLTKGVMIGIMVTDAFYYPNKDGIIEYPNCQEKEYGGHSLLVDGYTYIDGELYLRIKNSWGDSWGVEHGHCYMSFEDYKAHTIDEGYVVVDEIKEQEITCTYPKTRLKAFVDDLIYKIKDFIYTKHKTS
jgi:hypothetical protein